MPATVISAFRTSEQLLNIITITSVHMTQMTPRQTEITSTVRSCYVFRDINRPV